MPYGESNSQVLGGLPERTEHSTVRTFFGWAIAALTGSFRKSAEKPASPPIVYRLPQPEDFTQDLLEGTEAGGGYTASRCSGSSLASSGSDDTGKPQPVKYDSFGLPRNG